MSYSSAVLIKYDRMGRSWSIPVRVALTAALVNGLIYAVGVVFGVFSSLQFRPVMGGQLTIGPVLIGSLVIPILAFAAYVVLSASHATSWTTFRRSAVLAIAMSLLLPMTFAAWTIPQILFTQIMHIVAGISALYGVSLRATMGDLSRNNRLRSGRSGPGSWRG